MTKTNDVNKIKKSVQSALRNKKNKKQSKRKPETKNKKSSIKHQIYWKISNDNVSKRIPLLSCN